VLADPLAPEMIAAVTARMPGGVKIHPMLLGTTGKAITAAADTVALERQAALETSDINAARHFEIDCRFHLLLPSLLTSSQIRSTC